MPVVSPCAVMLSVVTSVGVGCLWPIFSGAMQMGMAWLHPQYSAVSLASDADDIMCFMMDDRVSTAPLLKCSSLRLVR